MAIVDDDTGVLEQTRVDDDTGVLEQTRKIDLAVVDDDATVLNRAVHLRERIDADIRNAVNEADIPIGPGIDGKPAAHVQLERTGIIDRGG